VQHHYAHILSLMAENKIGSGEKIIGISTDGVGYGDDGNIWGGEILLTSYNDYDRLGFLEYQPMIGGDRCTKYPARMAASIILNNLGINDSLNFFKKIGLEKDLEYKDNELKTLVSQFGKVNQKFSSENIPLTSSTGRIFDVVSYLLGVANIKTYRGEPAMRLEALASRGDPNNIDLEIKHFRLLENSKYKRADIAAKFQIEMGKAFAEIALEVAKENQVKHIGLTGGVAYNYSFSRSIKEKVINEGFLFLEHNFIAPGDAGISIGQLIGGLFKYQKENL